MLARWLAEGDKKLRFAGSFLARRLVHTNLQILYDCNFRCQICDFWKEPYRGRARLSAEQVRVIARKLDQIGPQIVSIGGGEPLLHDEILEITEELAVRHFPVMITNGSLITPALARDLFRAGLYEVSVSVDYAGPAQHDAQRGVAGSFDQAIAALQALQAGRVRPWQRVHMISVVMDDNLEEIEPLIQLCARLGITYLVTLYSCGRGRSEARARRPEIGPALLRLKRYRHFVQLRGYLERFTEAAREGGVAPCHAGRNLCNIDSQGNVTLCIDRLDEPVGNILEEGPREIENKLLTAHRANRCHACWTSCRGAIETLMYDGGRAANLLDYYQMTRSVGLGRSFA